MKQHQKQIRMRLFLLLVSLGLGSIAFAQGFPPGSPSKEYIYLNGQVIAIENAGSGGQAHAQMTTPSTKAATPASTSASSPSKQNTKPADTTAPSPTDIATSPTPSPDPNPTPIQISNADTAAAALAAFNAAIASFPPKWLVPATAAPPPPINPLVPQYPPQITVVARSVSDAVAH